MKSKLILCSSLVLVGAIDVRAMNDIRDFRHSWRKGQQIGYSSESDNEKKTDELPEDKQDPSIPESPSLKTDISENSEYNPSQDDGEKKPTTVAGIKHLFGSSSQSDDSGDKKSNFPSRDINSSIIPPPVEPSVTKDVEESLVCTKDDDDTAIMDENDELHQPVALDGDHTPKTYEQGFLDGKKRCESLVQQFEEEKFGEKLKVNIELLDDPEVLRQMYEESLCEKLLKELKEFLTAAQADI